MLLHFDEVVLLGTEDRPRPGDPDPSDELRSREMVVLHRVTSDEGAGSTEPRLAVHRQRALGRLCDMQKFLHNLHRGDAAVGEVQLVMRYAIFDEIAGLVGLVIEPHHCLHAQFLEDGRIVVGSKGPILD